MRLFYQLSHRFASSKSYMIFKNIYLIQKPPTKTFQNAFILFNQDYRKANPNPGLPVSKNSFKVAAIWKNLPQNEKQKYIKQANASFLAYQTVYQQYQKKYINPFKNVNAMILYMRKIAKDANFTDVSRDDRIKYFQKRYKAISTQEKADLEAEARRIKQENNLKKQEFLIPEKINISEQKFEKHVSLIKSVSNSIVIQKGAYDKIKQSWQKRIGQWLAKKNIQLTVEQFIQLYNNNQKLEKKKLTEQVKPIKKDPIKKQSKAAISKKQNQAATTPITPIKSQPKDQSITSSPSAQIRTTATQKKTKSKSAKKLPSVNSTESVGTKAK